MLFNNSGLWSFASEKQCRWLVLLFRCGEGRGLTMGGWGVETVSNIVKSHLLHNSIRNSFKNVWYFAEHWVQWVCVCAAQFIPFAESISRMDGLLIIALIKLHSGCSFPGSHLSKASTSNPLVRSSSLVDFAVRQTPKPPHTYVASCANECIFKVDETKDVENRKRKK